MFPTPGQQDLVRTMQTLQSLGETRRFWDLNQYEALWKGRQYDGKPSFWDKNVPLQERAPCVQSSFIETMGRVFIRFVFGESSFPSLQMGESDYGMQFTSEEAAALVTLAERVSKQAKLRITMPAFFEEGLKVGTGVCLLGVKRGRLFAEILSAKYCTPCRGQDGEIETLEIGYLCQHNGGHARFKRVIDRTCDTTFFEREITERGLAKGEWIPDPARTVVHDLGFVPIIWHAHRPDPSDPGSIDGIPLAAGIENEVAALDMAMSQHHRNARYNGEPQMVRVGYDPSEAAPMGEVGRSNDPQKSVWQKFLTAFRPGTTEAATKKAPGKIWDIPAGGDAKLVETSGAGAIVLQGDIEGLRRSLLERKSVVLATPEEISANASAALMKELFAPTLMESDLYREEYGPVYTEVVSLLLRVALRFKQTNRPLFLSGLDALLTAADRLSMETEAGMQWIGVPFNLSWGDYFPPTWVEIYTALGACKTASDKPVLSQRRALKMLQSITGVDDIEQELLEITVSPELIAQHEQLKADHTQLQKSHQGQKAMLTAYAAKGGGNPLISTGPPDIEAAISNAIK